MSQIYAENTYKPVFWLKQEQVHIIDSSGILKLKHK